jgi:two-component system sensor histidine kinase/response regulator
LLRACGHHAQFEDEASMNATTNASIVVVEDNRDLNYALCEILTSCGYHVRAAHNGYEALDLLDEVRPDVILCDIMMPAMDGYTLLQHTRSDVSLRTLPFIFLTARSSAEDQRRAKEIGIEDYLTKPIDSNDLLIAIENALQRSKLMREEAERKLDDLRNRIVGLLQHEFRTPLTFVLGYAELLANTDAAGINLGELKMAAAAILDGGRRLQRLIEGFLLLAELQNRTLNLGEMERLDAGLLWRDVAQELEDEASGQGLTIFLEAPPTPVYLLGDAHLIEEALRRMLDNAIRYRRPESKVIQLSVNRWATYLGLRITDDGMGIPAERLAEFARPFEQPNREQRSSTGAGLSLAMIKHVALLHGGQLEIESVYGQGSTFTLWLVAAASD